MKQLNLHFLLSLMCLSFVAYSSRSSAQSDTVRVMAYNVLDYGSYPLCQGPNSIYNAYLETIVQYANPDIISLEKMGSIQTSPTDDNYSAAIGFQDSILQFALNAAYPGRFNYCPFTNYAASPTEDLLFYNQQKLGFDRILCTYTNTEDFNTYKLYYLDPNLATTHDTTFLYVTVNHDISGSTDASERGAQIAGEMAQLETHFTHLANMINMGDFNLRNTDEPLYQTLTQPADTNYKYYDPPFYPDGEFTYPADWDDNPASYTNCLTTSTRLSGSVPNSCGTSGGAKDWFDHIFLSPWIINNSNYISYIPHSFKALGNDGHRLGISVNEAPTNTAVPSSVASALFQMSNKYPVLVDLLVTPNTTGTSLPNPEIEPSVVANYQLNSDKVNVANPVGAQLMFNFSGSLVGESVSITCTDMLGQVRMNQTFIVGQQVQQISCDLTPGAYIVRVVANNNIVYQAVVSKI